MGDVNHRCAHKKKKKKKKKKHVHSTSRAKAKRKRRHAIKEGCCCLFQYTDAATHIHASRVMHVHLTLFVFFFLSRSSIDVISV
jgi:hypothetical protein